MRIPVTLFLAFAAIHAPVPATAQIIGPLQGQWRSIFNGHDLQGWTVVIDGQSEGRDSQKIFQVDDGMIHIYRDSDESTQQPFGYIVTDKKYGNYDVTFEYKWGVKRFAPRATKIRDSGLLYGVTDLKGVEGVWPRAIECQVAEGETGDIYAVNTRFLVPVALDDDPEVKIYLPGGQIVASGTSPQGGPYQFRHSPKTEREGWNTVEVRVRAHGAVHIVNGVVVSAWTRPSEEYRPELLPGWDYPPGQGRFLLQSEGAEVFFRNVRVRE